MIAIINKKIPYGIIDIPSSKSIAHRMLINAALCNRKIIIKKLPLNDDILTTINCLQCFGSKIKLKDDICIVYNGIFNKRNKRILNVNNSGSTLRFLIPIALLDDIETIFLCDKRLLERPLDVYEDIANDYGFQWIINKQSISIKGRLRPGVYKVPGNISSQYITGLMFALSMLNKESHIIITTDIESKPYINLSICIMKKFGINILWNNSDITVYPSKRKIPNNLIVEGDYSGAAVFGAMNVLGGNVIINGLNSNSIQGDKIWKEYFRLFDASSNIMPKISIKDCPDLGPVLMAIGASLNGCRLLNTYRLKMKESDRSLAMAIELKKFGVNVDIFDNEVVVHNDMLKKPIEIIYGHNDHRIVMALVMLLLFTGGKIEGCEAVNKSMPTFFDLLARLHADFDLYD